MIHSDHGDYREWLFSSQANRCYQTLKEKIDQEVSECDIKERITSQPLPESEVKRFRGDIKIRPAELLFNVPAKEALQKISGRLSMQGRANYQEIFNRCQRLLQQAHQGYYQEALLACEGITKLEESRLLQRELLSKLPEIATRQAALEYPPTARL